MCARHLMKCEGERRGVRVVAWPLLLVLVAVAMCGAVMRSGGCASVRWRVCVRRGCASASQCAPCMCECFSVLARARAARAGMERMGMLRSLSHCNVGCRIACHGACHGRVIVVLVCMMIDVQSPNQSNDVDETDSISRVASRVASRPKFAIPNSDETAAKRDRY